jgi:hypothetical protein
VAELAKTLLALVTVLGMTALLLAGMDAVPRALAPVGEAVSTLPSVEAAEKRLNAKLALPSYFPESLAWPPVEVRVARGSPPSARVSLSGRDGGSPRVVLCQTIGGEGDISHMLLTPPARVLDARAVDVGGERGSLARIETSTGELWYDLGWHHGGQTLVLRTRGTVDEALMMAASVRRPR